MRIILTGATGFIGRRVTSLLLERGYQVICLLRRQSATPPGTTSLAVDLIQPATLEALPAGDAVIHLAQSSRYREFPDSADDIFAVNTVATARLLNLAVRNGTRVFVLASTGNVYAGSGPWTESATLGPSGFYGASKVAAEALLPAYAPYFRTCALRLFTPYGPGQRDRLVPSLIARLRERRPISLDGNGGGLGLSVAYVDDVASTFRAAVEHAWEGIYNVASPAPTCIAELANTIGSILGVTPRFERTGRNEPQSIIADVSRLKTVHDVDAFRPLAVGMASTLLNNAAG
jgi:UDP-glucose 4-epimerase